MREQRGDGVGGLGGGQVLEEVAEVGVGFEAVGLDALNEAIEQRAGLGAGGAAGEQPALAVMRSCA
jgi:hypothetical protein